MSTFAEPHEFVDRMNKREGQRKNYINRLLGDESPKKSRHFECDRREKICHNFVTVRTLSNVM